MYFQDPRGLKTASRALALRCLLMLLLSCLSEYRAFGEKILRPWGLPCVTSQRKYLILIGVLAAQFGRLSYFGKHVRSAE